MGNDWIRETEKKFRRRLQKSASNDMKISQLYVPEEKVSTRYPCHWIDEGCTKELNTRLTIYQRTDKSYVAVLCEKDVVAQVRGEAAQDIKRLFSDHPKLCNILTVEIVHVGKPSEPFFVQAVADAKAKAATK
jgi:hypothetical protein